MRDLVGNREGFGMRDRPLGQVCCQLSLINHQNASSGAQTDDCVWWPDTGAQTAAGQVCFPAVQFLGYRRI